MNTRSPYPDAEVPEISLPRFTLDRADERGTAVPLTGPADPGTTTPLMGPATASTITPLLGPADRGTMHSLMGPADPGTATPLMLLSRQYIMQTARRTSRPGCRRPAGGPGRPGWEQITIPGRH